MEFLYWFRDDPKRELKTDIEWATTRFKRKFGCNPECLLVHPIEEEAFVNCGFNIKADNKIQQGYFGVN